MLLKWNATLDIDNCNFWYLLFPVQNDDINLFYYDNFSTELHKEQAYTESNIKNSLFLKQLSWWKTEFCLEFWDQIVEFAYVVEFSWLQ